jgi:hypothetical protein
MLNWFRRPEVERITYEEMQRATKDTNEFIVSTLPIGEQSCLVLRTLTPVEEEKRLNDCLKKGEASRPVVVYGRNAGDRSPEKKCAQLVGLGFTSVRLYAGGLFEWALLQDIYGTELFPTTSACKDPLMFARAQQLRLTA